MNKNFKLYSILWAIAFAIFNVVVFVSPSEAMGYNKFGGAFLSGYIFITLAFIGQLAVSYFALKEENLRKLFYNISLLNVSRTGLILTLIFGTACMAIPNLPNWVGIILCVVVLGFTAIAVIKAKFAADLVAEKDDKIKAQTFFIKSLTVDADTLMSRAKTAEIKAECKKVYEAVRYSDPMSSDALASAESEITVKFSKLCDAVSAEDAEKTKEIAEELIILIADRNKKCKMLK